MRWFEAIPWSAHVRCVDPQSSLDDCDENWIIGCKHKDIQLCIYLHTYFRIYIYTLGIDWCTTYCWYGTCSCKLSINVPHLSSSNSRTGWVPGPGAGSKCPTQTFESGLEVSSKFLTCKFPYSGLLSRFVKIPKPRDSDVGVQHCTFSFR